MNGLGVLLGVSCVDQRTLTMMLYSKQLTSSPVDVYLTDVSELTYSKRK